MAVAMPQDVDLFATLVERECESAPSSPALNADDLGESIASTTKRSNTADDEDDEDADDKASTTEEEYRDDQDTETEAFEAADPLERSLQRMLQTRCFSGLDGKTTTYLYTTQLTHSNVVSTVVTSRPFNLKRRQNSLLALNNNSSSNNNSSEGNSKPAGGLLDRKKGPAGGGSRNQDLQATHVYGQPCNPKKFRNQQKGKYQAQLPAYRRSLPSLPIPVNRLNQELIQVWPLYPTPLLSRRLVSYIIAELGSGYEPRSATSSWPSCTRSARRRLCWRTGRPRSSRRATEGTGAARGSSRTRSASSSTVYEPFAST